jgi:hypothetical protein
LVTQSSELSRSIIEFLHNSSVPKVRHCDRCGALMEHIRVICYFAGKEWDIGLPVCPECEPDSGELLEHRRAS